MAFDGVPWLIGGGAEHSPEVARLLAFAAVGGAEGVLTPAAMKVRPLAVPGTAVRIDPGPASILNRSVGGEDQAYVARNSTSTQVDIGRTPSSGGRSDLIVARVEDPNMAGELWGPPASVKAGPYIHARVIAGVPAGTKRLQDVPGYANHSAITLARIDIPASTGTITESMIVDLRRLCTVRSSRASRQANSTGTPVSTGRNALVTASQQFIRWPDVALWQIETPAWATHAIIRGSVESYAVKQGSTTGRIRATFAGKETNHTSFDENHNGSDTFRNGITFGGEVAIAPQYRGIVNALEFQGTRSENLGFLDADIYTASLLDITFEERIG